MNPNTEELSVEVVSMLETEFGEDTVEARQYGLNGVYRQFKVAFDELKYKHEQEVQYKDDEIVAQAKGVYWMVVGKEPVVSRVKAGRGPLAWRIVVEGEPKLEFIFDKGGSIWIWIIDPSMGR